jgi:hypothetical protein
LTGAYKSVGRISFLTFENSVFLKSARFFEEGSTYYLTPCRGHLADGCMTTKFS